jgi:hypothetical protein
MLKQRKPNEGDAPKPETELSADEVLLAKVAEARAKAIEAAKRAKREEEERKAKRAREREFLCCGRSCCGR